MGAVAGDADEAAQDSAAPSTSCRCGTRSGWPKTTRWPTSSPTGASSWGSGAAITPARSRRSAGRCSIRRPTAKSSRRGCSFSLNASTRRPSTTRASISNARRAVPYRGYDLKEITMVPRPKHLPVEIWMPIASGRTIDLMAQYGLKAMVTLNGEKILDDVVRAFHACLPSPRPAGRARPGHDLGRRHLPRRHRGRGNPPPRTGA